MMRACFRFWVWGVKLKLLVREITRVPKATYRVIIGALSPTRDQRMLDPNSHQRFWRHFDIGGVYNYDACCQRSRTFFSLIKVSVFQNHLLLKITKMISTFSQISNQIGKGGGGKCPLPLKTPMDEGAISYIYAAASSLLLPRLQSIWRRWMKIDSSGLSPSTKTMFSAVASLRSASATIGPMGIPFIHSFTLFLQRLFESSTTHRPSRHSTDTVSGFHAEAPQATASEGLA